MRAHAEKRHNDWKKAIRKRKIDREVQGTAGTQHDLYDNLHQYSKNKIHCSCPLCRGKTAKRRQVLGSSNKNWTIADQRQIDEMKEQQEEFIE